MTRIALPLAALALLGAAAPQLDPAPPSAPAIGLPGPPAGPPKPKKPKKPKEWSEATRGAALSLAGARLVYDEPFDRALSLDGPVLWAAQHAPYGKAKFDPPGGAAYAVRDGTLVLRAYQGDTGPRGANVQSTSADQSYKGARVVPGRQGFTCAGCYWEARIRFPQARGGWGAFWLLTPDDPAQRGHLEVDAIEYYGTGDRRGHHHALHRWLPKDQGGHSQQGDYTGMKELADFGWHTYGADLRGAPGPDGKRYAVVYLDGREVGRIAASPEYFTKPFYYLLSLTLRGKLAEIDLPQEMQVDYVRVWRPR